MREIVKRMFSEIEFGHDNMIDKQFSIRDRIVREGYNQYRYYLWGSNIFTKKADGTIEFSFCGYMTNTTKDRIHDFMHHEVHFPCSVYQKDYQMHLLIGDSVIDIDICKRYSINVKTREVKVI